jgi:hypothetical protein
VQHATHDQLAERLELVGQCPSQQLLARLHLLLGVLDAEAGVQRLSSSSGSSTNKFRLRNLSSGSLMRRLGYSVWQQQRQKPQQQQHLMHELKLLLDSLMRKLGYSVWPAVA